MRLTGLDAGSANPVFNTSCRFNGSVSNKMKMKYVQPTGYKGVTKLQVNNGL